MGLLGLAITRLTTPCRSQRCDRHQRCRHANREESHRSDSALLQEKQRICHALIAMDGRENERKRLRSEAAQITS